MTDVDTAPQIGPPELDPGLAETLMSDLVFARRLSELGIPTEIVDAALGQGAGLVELARALDALRGRLAAPPADERERDRALRLLARRGFELDLAYDAVRAFERA